MVELERPEVWPPRGGHPRPPRRLTRRRRCKAVIQASIRPRRRQGAPDPPLVCTAFNADFDGDQMAVHYAAHKAQV